MDLKIKAKQTADGLVILLKQEIKLRGITNTHVAKALGIPVSNLYQFTGSISLTNFLKICYAARIDPMEIIMEHQSIKITTDE